VLCTALVEAAVETLQGKQDQVLLDAVETLFKMVLMGKIKLVVAVEEAAVAMWVALVLVVAQAVLVLL
jgi:hypothetical protein